MKTFILTIIFYLIYFNAFPQKVKIQYLLIDDSDTLIKKQIATNKNKFESYTIINENRVVKKYKKPTRINGDDIEVEVYDCYSFSFDRKNDTIVDKFYLKRIDFLKTREEFFSINKKLDETKNKFIFIIPIDSDKFILRKVRPLILE